MIRLPQQIRDAIVAHAEFCAPQEACGLIAFDAAGSPRMAYCLTNVEQSASRFTVSPQEHFMAIRHAEQNDWSIGAVFHSHPGAAARPSPHDVAGAHDPHWLHFIVGPMSAPLLRAFRISGSTTREVEIVLV